MIPRLVAYIEREGELHVRIDADSNADFNALVEWLCSRPDLAAYIDVLGEMYRLAKDSGDA
jgi:hypothetical protein